VGGACLLLVAAGLSAGLGYGIPTGSVSTQVPRLLGAALARLPATMVLTAVAVSLFGLLPWESVALAWTAMALVGVIAVFGPPLQWPAWMTDVSPFTQTPKLPGAAVSAGPLLSLCGIALALGTAGLAGLRRRDIGDLGPTGLVRPLFDGLADYIRESNEISQQAALGTTQPPVQPSPSTPPGPPARPG
jgi:ABC-2 type transport system permease protein